jgi:laminin, alpha 3/5
VTYTVSCLDELEKKKITFDFGIPTENTDPYAYTINYPDGSSELIPKTTSEIDMHKTKDKGQSEGGRESQVDESDIRTDVNVEENEIEPDEETEARNRQEEEEARAREAERQREEDEHRLEEERRREEDSATEVPPTRATTKATVRTTKKPRPPAPDNPPLPTCALPIQPNYDVDFDAGFRFGTQKESRVEFDVAPSKSKKSYDISLQFKTEQPDGVLFYAADARHTDFIALYMKAGILHHLFRSGSGTVDVASQLAWDDREWHTVRFTRQQTKGKILVDDTDEQVSETQQPTRPMTLLSPIYVGGIDPKFVEDVGLNLNLDKNTLVKNNSFSGCIKNIQIGGKAIGDFRNVFGVLPCSEEIESGVFFGKDGGYVKLFEKFKVGTDFTVSLDIKPRTTTAILLSVHGRNAFLILQMLNGTINFTVDNGDATPMTAIFVPDDNVNFCDGKWRTVKAIKSSYVITIQVDGYHSEPAIGTNQKPSTDTTRPLFLGGHPHLTKIRGLQARKPYHGCIRNVKIRNEVQKIDTEMTNGFVQTGICPLN